uniref:Membrane-associated progesterone receptor component 2 n=1 Tax=Schistocephalus solidus TaxID=70667 RepID=A0A0V0J8I6_SCHSO
MFAYDSLAPNIWVFCGSLVFLIGLALTACYTVQWLNRKPKHGDVPNMPKRDFTLDELSQFNGEGPDGRILIAVNGSVFDVTNNGKSFYGKDGPYAMFAGRDASRSLAMFSANMPPRVENYDDLSDLTSDQMNKLKEWELQFRERYHLVGRLLAPSEPHHVYERDDDDTCAGDASADTPKSKDD